MLDGNEKVEGATGQQLVITKLSTNRYAYWAVEDVIGSCVDEMEGPRGKNERSQCTSRDCTHMNQKEDLKGDGVGKNDKQRG